MHFEMKKENWTQEAGTLWGDILGYDRDATFEEARDSFRIGFEGAQFSDYFDGDEYKGPCVLGVSVEDQHIPAD